MWSPTEYPEAPCDHPKTSILDLNEAENSTCETDWIEWCGICGAYRMCWNLPKDAKTDWRLPEREKKWQ